MNNGKPRLPWFVEQMKKHDAEIYRLSADSAETALAEGALDSKTKLLIVLALDALKGAAQGVKVVAAQARAAGASEDEIAEALRLAYYVSGMDVVKTCLNAYETEDNGKM
ncbi:MAG: carboxymuconolactone decarboxylase family protein [Syntrophomonadaceae bacterium]|jgi:AhpD family alkylhydroperoxidase